LVALLILKVATLLQDVWGRGALTELAIATAVPAVALWVGLRASMGLYPGYGLDAVEEVRRNTYAAFTVLAMLAIFAVGFHIIGLLSRLLLLLFFSGLLILASFTRHLTKVILKQGGHVGQPVIIFGSGQNEGRERGRVATLSREN
jgi:hypothetical protein